MSKTTASKVRVSNTENSHLITGLAAGVTYIVQVHAVIKDIQSEADKIEATTGESKPLLAGQKNINGVLKWVCHFWLKEPDAD